MSRKELHSPLMLWLCSLAAAIELRKGGPKAGGIGFGAQLLSGPQASTVGITAHKTCHACANPIDNGNYVGSRSEGTRPKREEEATWPIIYTIYATQYLSRIFVIAGGRSFNNS